MVIIFISGFCIFIKNAYRVVVFPEPMAPVIIIIPLGFFISFCKILYKSSLNSSDSKPTKFLGFKILITIDSPYSAGKLDVLISINKSSMLIVNLPSWGVLVIFNLIFDKSFILERRLWYMFWLKKTASCKTPSSLIRNLI